MSTGESRVYTAEFDRATGKVVSAPLAFPNASLGNAHNPEWSPDGHSVAYLHTQLFTSRQPSIVVRSLASGESREFPLPVQLSAPSHRWSPDGGSLLIRANEKSRWGLYRLDIQTGKTEILFRLGAEETIHTFDIAPDGRTVVIRKSQATLDGNELITLLAHDLGTGEQRELYRIPPGSDLFYYAIAISPDGRDVGFVQRGQNGIGLVLQPLAGGPTRTFHNLPANTQVSGVRWSHDGRFVTVSTRSPAAGNEAQKVAVWRVPVDGGAATRIGLEGEGIAHPALDRSGERILFTSGTSGAELWVMENFLPGWKGNSAR